MDKPTETALSARARTLQRFRVPDANPPRINADVRERMAALGDIVGSPAWQRILEIKEATKKNFFAPYNDPAQEKRYQTYCLVRDILDDFVGVLEADAQLSSVFKE